MHDVFVDGFQSARPNSANRVVHTNVYVVVDHGQHARFASPKPSLNPWPDHDPDPEEPMVEPAMLTHFTEANNTLLQLSDNYQLHILAPIDDTSARRGSRIRLARHAASRGHR